MFRWTGSVGALAGALTLALVGPAGAATGFLTDETLTSAGAGAFDVAMAPNGYAIAGWVEGATRAQVVRVSTRPPGGDWSAPQSFPVSLDYSTTVSVAIASTGAAAVAWEEVTSPTTFDVGVASRPAGGAFAEAEVLRDGTQSYSPSVGIAADGTVTLLYSTSPAAAVLRDFAAGGSALAATLQPLAASCTTSFGNGISVAPSGDAVAPLSCSGASFALRTRGSWSVSPPVADDVHSCPSGSTYHTAVTASIDSAGHPVGVLETHVFQPDFMTCVGPLQSDSYSEQLVLPLAGVMTPVSAPVASGSSFGGFGPFPISGPQAAISPNGIVFSWGAGDMTFRTQANARFFAPDGSGGTADQPVGQQVTGSLYPRLALAGNGRGLLSWVQSDGTTLSVVAAEREPAANAFGTPQPLVSGRDLGFPMLAMDDAGDGLAAWTQGPGPVVLHVRGYDATAPTLTGVSIPASATVGAAATFSAAPFDAWGPLTTTWSFGDGTAATGTSVTHAYASAGTFTASVTSTDAVGNAATSSATVQATAAPAAGGSGAGGGSGGPAISGLSLTHRRFRVGRARTAVSARRRRAPVGTTFSFQLDRAAGVKIAFAKRARGLRSGRRCVKPSRRLRRAHARRCTRRVAIRPALTRAVRAGANAVPFSGRIGRRALAPGRYVATLTATADGSAGPPSGIRFAVVR